MKPLSLEGGHDLPTPEALPPLPGVTVPQVTALESSSTQDNLERYRVTVFEQEHEKNQETPISPNSKDSKDFGFYDPHTMTRESLEQGIAAARADLCRNLPDQYRLELAQWLEVAEVIHSMDTLKTKGVSSNDTLHSLEVVAKTDNLEHGLTTFKTEAVKSPNDPLEHGQTVPTLKNASQSQNAKVSNLVYEVTPGHAEGWERVTLERTVQGVKVVVCQGHAQYKLEPTAFVLQGLLKTIKRIARGELAHAELGRVGWRALEITARKGQVLA
jgi:hypothetical protein